jgi:hypothetical protein
VDAAFSVEVVCGGMGTDVGTAETGDPAGVVTTGSVVRGSGTFFFERRALPLPLGRTVVAREAVAGISPRLGRGARGAAGAVSVPTAGAAHCCCGAASTAGVAGAAEFTAHGEMIDGSPVPGSGGAQAACAVAAVSAVSAVSAVWAGLGVDGIWIGTVSGELAWSCGVGTGWARGVGGTTGVGAAICGTSGCDAG